MCERDAQIDSAYSAHVAGRGLPTVAGYFLPRYLAKFQTNALGIGTELFEGPRSMIEQRLIDGELDLAVMLISNLVLTEQLSSKMLLRSVRRLWVAPSHPITRLRSITLTEVAKYPYVMLTTDESSSTTLRYWTAQGLKPKTVFRTSSIEAVRSMVGSGLGVTILSELIYRPRSYDNQRIELLDLADTVPTMDIGLVWRTDSDLPPLTQAFCDFLQFSSSGDDRAAMEVHKGQRHSA
nr:LysR substrate-binding domain-containing protein [Mesorhizobium sediminum]